jgi:hypothetical protein
VYGDFAGASRPSKIAVCYSGTVPNPTGNPRAEIREMGRAALDLVAEYYDTLATRAVLRPTTSADLRRRLDEPAPATGLPFADLLDTVRDVVEEFSRHAATRDASVTSLRRARRWRRWAA